MSDQPQQPLFSTLAHVFRIDPDTKKSWVPISKQAVNVSYYYDNSKFIYRIVSIEDARALINSTITSGMTFTKTSQKFGQWSDAKANTVYGLGFATEGDLNKFSDKFNEMKNNVKQGTPPATPKFPSHNPMSTTSATSDSYPPVTGGSLKSMSSNSTASIEDDQNSPGSHRSSSTSTDTQLKYENDRLKKALAQSSANAKKWENEFQTLKNNNARLTAALQESAVNVEKWKEQLHNYKEENSKLRKKLSSKSSANDTSSSSSMNELQQQLQDLQVKLKRKEEELHKLSTHSSGELNLLREKNAELSTKLQKSEAEGRRSLNNSSDSLKQSKVFQEHKMQQLFDIRNEFEVKLKEMNSLQQQLGNVLKS